MTKYILILMLLATPAHAVKPYIDLSFGRFNATAETPSSFIGGIGYGLGLGHMNVAIDAMHIRQINNTNALLGGIIELIPVHFTLQSNMPIGKQFFANLGGGIGYTLVNHELSQEQININQRNIQKKTNEIENDISFIIRGGITKKLTKHTSLAFSIGYYIFQPEATIIQKNGFLRKTWRSTVFADFNSIIGLVTLRFN